MMLVDNHRLVMREQVERRAADDLGGLAAKDFGAFRVSQQIAALAILEVQYQRHVVHQRCQPGLAFAQRLLDAPALGDVGDHAQHGALAFIVDRPG